MRDVPRADGEATLSTSPCGSKRPKALIALTCSLALLVAGTDAGGLLLDRPTTTQMLTPSAAKARAIAGIKNLFDFFCSRAFFMVVVCFLAKVLCTSSDILTLTPFPV